MGQKIASLEIELGMATGGAVADLNRFGGVVDKVSASAIRDIDRIDAAMKNVGGLDAATASAVKLAEATARTAIAMARDADRSERNGERLVAQMERQIAVYGLTKVEVRALRAEEAARAADASNQGELAARIRAREAELYAMEFAAARKAQQAADDAAQEAVIAAEKAAAAKEREAQAVRSAANAYQMFEARVRAGAAAMREEAATAADAERRFAARGPAMFEAYARQKSGEYRDQQSAQAAADAERAAAALRAEAASAEEAARSHKVLAAAVQGSHAAQMADAEAAERLRMSTDPLYASTARLNAEIAESTRLYHAGATAPAEYARQQEVLAERLNGLTVQNAAVGTSGRLAGHHMQNLAFQFQDLGIQAAAAAGSSEPLKMMMMALMQQGAQIQGIMMQAGIGVRGLATSVLGLIAPFAPLIIAVGAGYAAFKLFQHSFDEDAGQKKFIAGLGLTEDEMKKLGSTSVSMGDIVKGVWKTISDATEVDEYLTGLSKRASDAGDWIMKAVGAVALGIPAAMYAAYQTVVAHWERLPQVFGSFFTQAFNFAIREINTFLGEAVAELNMLSRGANNLIGSKVFSELAAPQLAQVKDRYATAGAAAADTFTSNFNKFMAKERGILSTIGGNITDANRERLTREANQIKADRKPDGPEKISAEQRAYEAAVKAAQNYIDAQDKQAAQIGKTAKEIRQLEDAAQRAKAPTEALRQEIDRAAAGREAAYSAKAATDFETNVLKPLRDEMALYGLVGPARAAAALELEKEAFLIQHKDDGLVVALSRWDAYYAGKRALIDKDISAENLATQQRLYNEQLAWTADRWDLIAANVADAGRGMAEAFGAAGRAIGDLASIYTSFEAGRTRREAERQQGVLRAQGDEVAIKRANDRYAIQSATAQIGLYGDMAAAARGFFKEGSDGYKAMTVAVQVFRAVEFALSVKAMVQDAAHTAASIAKSAARAVAHGVEAVAKAIASLPFPANLAAGAATIAALAAIGVSIVGGIGGGGKLPEANEGRGTVLGDASAQSESVRRGIDQLKEVDVLMLNASRQMASHLRSIDNQIGGFAAQIVRSGNVDASGGIDEGFKKNIVGSILGSIPVIGGLLGGLFGTKTSVVGSGLYGGAQTVGSILDGGFDASTYSDVEKKKKLFGITTSTKRSTQYSDADASLENQFTLILRGFASAIGAAAEPLGQATDAVQARLNGFVVNIGKIDLQGLTGAEIEEKLEAIFGAAADGMAGAVYPGLQRFQKAGEGAFETMVRVASTVEAVTASFEMMGRGGIGIDASMALAGLFDSLSDLTNAQQGYFEAYYTDAEQAAARLAQVQGAVGSLGLKLPGTLAGFRALVEAQDLTSAAGRETYATLIQLAPAFADLQAAMGGAKSAADIAAERQDLERKLLELNGDQAAIRALDLAKLDASNRGLQQQVWAAEAAKEAAAKAEELRKAWSSVGDSIMDEVRRIRGISDAQGPAGFAAAQGQFNAVTAAARAGDMESAKQLPALSRTLLEEATKAATSRQELDRVQAMAAASLEATYAAIDGFGTSGGASESAARTAETMAQATAAATTTASATTDMVGELRRLREEVAALRADNNTGHAATAGNTGRIAKKLDDVTPNGDAIMTEAA